MFGVCECTCFSASGHFVTVSNIYAGAMWHTDWQSQHTYERTRARTHTLTRARACSFLFFSFLFFFFFFLFSFFITLHLPLVGNLGRLTRIRLQQPQEQRHLFLTVCAVFSCVQTKVWLPMLGIFNVHTDVNVFDCTQGLYRHRKKVLHWKLTLGDKSLAAPGSRSYVSGVPVRHSSNWATTHCTQHRVF